MSRIRGSFRIGAIIEGKGDLMRVAGALMGKRWELGNFERGSDSPPIHSQGAQTVRLFSSTERFAFPQRRQCVGLLLELRGENAMLIHLKSRFILSDPKSKYSVPRRDREFLPPSLRTRRVDSESHYARNQRVIIVRVL